ncbi:MAG: NADH-quinone oxidoreductase subunit NuoE [Candidatus Aminicenantales bacterium]
MAVESEKIRSLVEKHNSEKKALISILQDIQSEYRYLPRESLELVAEMLAVPLVDVVGVATFYRAFSLKPRGKHMATVCLGTACHVRGGPKILDEFERRLDLKSGDTTADGRWSLETVACLGCCAIGPVVVVDKDYHAHTSVRNVGAILKKHQK